jgi:hypothetical protein
MTEFNGLVTLFKPSGKWDTSAMVTLTTEFEAGTTEAIADLRTQLDKYFEKKYPHRHAIVIDEEEMLGYPYMHATGDRAEFQNQN